MKTFRNITTITAALLLAGGAFAAEHPSEGEQEKAGLLDGKVFVGELGKSGEEVGDKDKLIFKNGTFVSTACVEHGFQAVAYKAEDKDGVITFTAQAKNEAGETMTWNGTVQDGMAKATAVYQSESDRVEYWYKGKKKDKKDKPGEHPDKSEHPTSEHPQ